MHARREIHEKEFGIASSSLNILFTCAGRRVALMESFRRAMVEMKISGRLLAADVSYASAAFHCADEGVLVPGVGTKEYVPALLENCRRGKVGLLVPLTDLDLEYLADQAEAFRAVGSQVMVGSPEVVRMCRDKTLTEQFLARIGLPRIRTLRLEEFRRRPFFPCFIKPVQGSASVGTGVIDDPTELKAHLATFGEAMLVQEYVPGAEYTLDIYRGRDGAVRCVVPRQRLSIRAGEVEKGLTVKDSELEAAGLLLGQRLDGVWGVVNAQCRRPLGGQAHFFEINPRFGGGAPLAIAAGANLPRYVIEETLGLPVSAKLGQFEPNLLMLRYDQAVFVRPQSPSDLPGFDTPQSR